jgi:hypothetical protein
MPKFEWNINLGLAIPLFRNRRGHRGHRGKRKRGLELYGRGGFIDFFNPD